MRLTVLGMGYLGATHAACMAELGHEVLGVEVHADKLARLAKGEVPFYEPGLTELLRKHIESGRLKVTASYPEAADWGDGLPPESWRLPLCGPGLDGRDLFVLDGWQQASRTVSAP